MPQIKLITFDLDNTLWDNDPVITQAEQAYYQFLRQHVPALTARYSLSDLAQQRIDFAHASAQTQPTLMAQISELRKQSLAILLPEFIDNSVDRQQLVNEAFACFYTARNNITLFSDTLALLKTLQQNYLLGALTNGNACIETIGLAPFFTISLSAEKIQSRKPDSAMFIEAMRMGEVQPEEVLHIGDHPVDDIQGAQQLGIQTVWFNPSQALWRDVSASESPTAEVDSLTKIPDLLAKINKRL